MNKTMAIKDLLIGAVIVLLSLSIIGTFALSVMTYDDSRDYHEAMARYQAEQVDILSDIRSLQNETLDVLYRNNDLLGR